MKLKKNKVIQLALLSDESLIIVHALIVEVSEENSLIQFKDPKHPELDVFKSIPNKDLQKLSNK